MLSGSVIVMGVSWCIEFASTWDMPLDGYLQHWCAFCRAGGCDDFVVPIDTTLYRFRRAATGPVDVIVETSDGKAVREGIGELRFPDGSYAELASLFDGFELFVPDHGPFRSALDEEQVWKFKRIVSLDVLLDLGPGDGLGGHMFRAATYARRHDLLIRVSY